STWQLYAGLGGALRSRGALAEAAGELRKGIEQIERVSGGLPLPEHRAAFREDKWNVYVELAFVERERGRTEAAFETSERLRERQMLDLLAQGRVAAGDVAPELATREQDLRRRMAELTRQLEASPDSAPALRDPARPGAATRATDAALDSAQEAYRPLLRALHAREPDGGGGPACLVAVAAAAVPAAGRTGRGDRPARGQAAATHRAARRVALPALRGARGPGSAGAAPGRAVCAGVRSVGVRLAAAARAPGGDGRQWCARPCTPDRGVAGLPGRGRRHRADLRRPRARAYGRGSHRERVPRSRARAGRHSSRNV